MDRVLACQDRPGLPFGRETPPEPLPLSLYAHFPWCVRKCPYCDFNSHAAPQDLAEQEYVTALLADLDEEAARVPGRVVASVFLGGGTPSLFTPRAVGRLLDGVARRLSLAPGCEITLEANPGSGDARRFRAYSAAGVNRLSLGVQSFDDRSLRRIGRIHDSAQSRASAGAAMASGFDRVNFDLMYALPDQSLDEALDDVQTALNYEPPHISHYELTVEPNTPFYAEPPSQPGSDKRWLMETRCRERLAGAGFQRYEISAYARSGARCVHNLNYWRFGDYVGIGAGAHGKLTDTQGAGVWRRRKHRHPRRYLEAARTGDFVAARWPVAPPDRPLEFLMNALRLTDGFSPGLYTAATGLPLREMRARLRCAQDTGLIEILPDASVRPTPFGFRHLNTLVGMFVDDEAPVRAAPRVKPDTQGHEQQEGTPP